MHYWVSRSVDSKHQPRQLSFVGSHAWLPHKIYYMNHKKKKKRRGEEKRKENPEQVGSCVHGWERDTGY